MGIYKNKRDGAYWVDYYYQGRRHRKKVGFSKRQAGIVFGKIKSQIAEDKYLDVKKNEKIKFEEISQTFIDHYAKINKKSWKRDALSIRNLSKMFKGQYIYEINNLDIENYKKQRLDDGVTYATINRELACLRTIFNKAVEWQVLKVNPPKITLYKEQNQRVRYLTKEEAILIINLSPEPLKSIVIIALNTGMRRGEILNLKWRDIDIKERVITLMDTKNREKRYIPMNNIVADTFLKIEPEPLSEYIFVGRDGKTHLSEHYVSHLFERILKQANIKDFRFHDLRHTFASWLVMKGIDLKTVQELLGHKTFNMTLRYSHLSPEHKKLAVEILEEKGIISGTDSQEKREKTDGQDAANGHLLDTKEKKDNSQTDASDWKI